MSDDQIDRVEREITAMLATALDVPAAKLDPATKLAELGVGSMKLLRMVAKLERTYEVQLSDDVLFSVVTVRDLAMVVARELR